VDEFVGDEPIDGGRKIRVLCVDDHHIIRDGIALIIGREPDMEVIASAVTAPEAVKRARECKPDVILMDLQLGATSGITAIEAIRGEDPEARIIVLTVHQGEEDIHRALRAGAAAYLLKDSLSDALIRVIREVHAGEQPLSADLKKRMAKHAAAPRLTARETQVMELIARGLRNKEIAAELGIAEDTTQVHVKNILAKLGVHDRTAAMNVALRRGIIHLR